MNRLMQWAGAGMLAAALSLAGLGSLGNMANAAGAKTTASQLCKTNGNAVFGANVHIGHRACVSAIKSHGRSSALYVALCKYLVKNKMTVSGAMLTPAIWLPTKAATNITNRLNAVAKAHTTPFTSQAQCVSAFSKARRSAAMKSISPSGASFQ